MKLVRRAPFEILNFRDYSIPLWLSFLIKDGWSFKCEPPLFARVDKSLRFLTQNSSKFLYTDK